MKCIECFDLLITHFPSDHTVYMYYQLTLSPSRINKLFSRFWAFVSLCVNIAKYKVKECTCICKYTVELKLIDGLHLEIFAREVHLDLKKMLQELTSFKARSC